MGHRGLKTTQCCFAAMVEPHTSLGNEYLLQAGQLLVAFSGTATYQGWLAAHSVVSLSCVPSRHHNCVYVCVRVLFSLGLRW